MRRAEKLINRFGAWSLSRLPALLLKAAVVLIILILGVQAGIKEGRQLERGEAGYAVVISQEEP